MSIISAEFPFESREVEVHGVKLHYVEQGEGSPILFLHGNPTSSYLWRNIIPEAAKHGRAIAMDLVGMGRSEKPDIEYRFVDHYRFVAGFIQALRLENLTLVLHDWGAALGFHYAMCNEANIKGLVFMEALLRPLESIEAIPEPSRELFTQFRTEDIGWKLIVDRHVFIEDLLPAAALRDLTHRELQFYRVPFADPASRKPIWRWANELPIGGEPEDVARLVAGYSARLQESEVPKLLLHATPGSIITPAVVDWAKEKLPNLTEEHVGDSIHLLPEDVPEEICSKFAEWYRQL